MHGSESLVKNAVCLAHHQICATFSPRSNPTLRTSASEIESAPIQLTSINHQSILWHCSTKLAPFLLLFIHDVYSVHGDMYSPYTVFFAEQIVAVHRQKSIHNDATGTKSTLITPPQLPEHCSSPAPLQLLPPQHPSSLPNRY